MKIKVKPGQTISTSGALHFEGDELDLPKAEAQFYIDAGRATEVTTKESKSDK